MRSLISLALVAACGGKAPVSDQTVPTNEESVVSGEPAQDTTESKWVTNETLPLGPAGSCAIGGMVLDAKSSEAIAGATIVVRTKANGQPVLTDENGRFLVHSPEVPEKVDVYYADLNESIVYTASTCNRALRISLDTTAPASK